MTNRKEFNLTVVRHGQTVANLQKIIQGQSNTPLTRLGIKQAELLGEYLSKKFNNTGVIRIYTSDQERAVTTCNVVSSYIGVSEDSIRKDDRLRERRYGKYEGRPIRDFILEALDHGYDDSSFTKYTPNGVESMEEVMTRVKDFLRDLCNECSDGSDALVFSHWATIKEFLKLLQPLSNGSITKEDLAESPNTAISKFKIVCAVLASHGDDFIAGVHVVCLNETPHLIGDQTSSNIKHQVD